jgi:hypothetical protein
MKQFLNKKDSFSYVGKFWTNVFYKHVHILIDNKVFDTINKNVPYQNILRELKQEVKKYNETII